LLPQYTFVGAACSGVMQVVLFCTCTDRVQHVHLFMGVKGDLSVLYFRIEPNFTVYNQLSLFTGIDPRHCELMHLL
jgi:hypothetical protein